MESFLLDHPLHVSFLLPFLEWCDLEYLSSCSHGLSSSLLRDYFVRHSFIVVPAPPQPHRDAAVRSTLARLPLSTCRVAVSNPSHLALLQRLPSLTGLRIANAKSSERLGTTNNSTNNPLDAIHFAPDDVVALWHLCSVAELELDAWVEDLPFVFRDMEHLRDLNLVFRYPIGDLNLLGHLSLLEALRVRGENLEDISAVAALPRLKTLELAAWGVHDVSAVQHLTRLERLDLSRCNVADLTPISGLLELRCLKIEECPVTELGPLANVVSLQYLSIARSRIGDLTPLRHRADSLRYLDVSGCTLTRVGALSHLAQLEALRMGKATWPATTDEPDVSSTLARLQHLRFVDGRINRFMLAHHPAGAQARLHLASLQQMRRLEYLELTGDSLAIAGQQQQRLEIPSLVWLRIEWSSSTREVDVPLIAVVHPRLQSLHLERVELSRVANLQYSSQLQELSLVDVLVGDLSMLAFVPKLARFKITCPLAHGSMSDEEMERGSPPPMSDISALRSLHKMQYLDLSCTSVEDISQLQGLHELRFLDLSSTNVADVTPLNQLQQLEGLWLRDTAIEVFDCRGCCRALRELALPEHVDCRLARQYAPHLRKLLHPDDNCLWMDHARDDDDGGAAQQGTQTSSGERQDY